MVREKSPMLRHWKVSSAAASLKDSPATTEPSWQPETPFFFAEIFLDVLLSVLLVGFLNYQVQKRMLTSKNQMLFADWLCYAKEKYCE